MSWRPTCFRRVFARFASGPPQSWSAAVVRSIAFPSGWSSFRRSSPSGVAPAVASRSASSLHRIDANVAPSGTPPQGAGSVVVVVRPVLVVVVVEDVEVVVVVVDWAVVVVLVVVLEVEVVVVVVVVVLGGGSVQSENSEVLPSGAIAVAVMTLPAGTFRASVTVNAASPAAVVVTAAFLPTNSCPSPVPDGS